MSRRPVVQMTQKLHAMLAAQDAKPPTRIELPQAVEHKGAFEGPEWELQAQCQGILAHRGVRFRFHMDRPRGNMEGVPDLIFAYRPAGAKNAIPCAVELKVKGGRMMPSQEKLAEEMQLDGWNVGEAWNVDEFRAFLDDMETKIEEVGT